MPPTDARIGPTRALPPALAIAALALLAARVIGGVWEASHAPPEPVDHVRWVPIEQADALAQVNRKPILYDFSAEWCGPCQMMSQEVFGDERSAALISSQFVPVRVVDRLRETGANPRAVDSLERAYSVGGFPTLVVAWPGSPVHERSVGYKGASGTMGWLVGAAQTVRMRALAAPGNP
jgi:thiol:disulfide interchange protein